MVSKQIILGSHKSLKNFFSNSTFKLFNYDFFWPTLFSPETFSSIIFLSLSTLFPLFWLGVRMYACSLLFMCKYSRLSRSAFLQSFGFSPLSPFQCQVELVSVYPLVGLFVYTKHPLQFVLFHVFKSTFKWWSRNHPNLLLMAAQRWIHLRSWGQAEVVPWPPFLEQAGRLLAGTSPSNWNNVNVVLIINDEKCFQCDDLRVVRPIHVGQWTDDNA